MEELDYFGFIVVQAIGVPLSNTKGFEWPVLGVLLMTVENMLSIMLFWLMSWVNIALMASVECVVDDG